MSEKDSRCGAYSRMLTKSRVASGDDFIANLWKVHCRVKEEGYVQASQITNHYVQELFSDCMQDLSLGLFRSDYMVHQDLSDPSSVPRVKQVEFNTIASSFGGLSSQTCLLHK